MSGCDLVLCIVGKETFSRPHVDWELHEALKGGIKSRKGIIAVLLENRLDSKKFINSETFPVRLNDNLDYIVIEQFSSLNERIQYACEKAKENSKDKMIQVINNKKPMELRKKLYFDN